MKRYLQLLQCGRMKESCVCSAIVKYFMNIFMEHFVPPLTSNYDIGQLSLRNSLEGLDSLDPPCKLGNPTLALGLK